jgi:anti-sigma regulatory factor (Ser/Thr protein kinase)
MQRTITVALECKPESATLARRVVRQFLARTDQVLADAMLVTSELVTNALLHGRDPVRLRLVSDDRTLHIEVFDGQPSKWVGVRETRPLDAEGRGLQLVETVARTWGVSREPDGKSVWADLVVC